MKIFGIGLSKTGTSSLARALEILGYRTKDYLGVEKYVRGDLNSIDRNIITENDAFTDTPIPSFYKELDRQYPNSKFILTVRETNGWLKSCKKQFTQKLEDKQNEAHKKLFMDLYGCSVFDEKLFQKGYNSFVNSVLEHFKDRPDDLLVLDIIGGDGWEKLCPFLDKPIPDVAFPKANVTHIRWMNIQDIVAIARQAGKEILTIYYAKHGIKNDVRRTDFLESSFFSSILAKCRYALCNNPQNIAANRAYKKIRDALIALSPAIPVISPLNSGMPYSERRRLNHFWLIDPLENEDAFLSGDNTFTINIALIEDNKPYMGVVYAPVTDTIFYGTLGKGSFCSESGAEPRQLGQQNSGCSEPSDKHYKMHTESKGMKKNVVKSESTALLICLIADGELGPMRTIEKSMEWQTAAAHAIAAAAGLKVKFCDTREDLNYNKDTFANDCITVV